MNIKKYFEEASKRGIEPYQITHSITTETSVEVFNGDVEVQQIGSAQDISAKGIVDGKQGSFGTDAIDSTTPSLMAENVFNSAKYGKETKAEYYFKGGLKYKKPKKPTNPFVRASLKDLRELALKVCKEIQAKDSRITQTSVSITLVDSEDHKYNSYGLKCMEKSSYYILGVEIVAEDENKEPRSSSRSVYSLESLDDLYSRLNEKIDEIISDAVDFFGSKCVKSKKYKVVLANGVASQLLSYFLGQLNAKSIQKHLSLMEGKLNQQVVSKCLTIKNVPHELSFGATSYDTDGYPTKDFTVIDKGILKTYFYSVETALNDKCESNGCALGNGNGSIIVKYVKPGKYSKEAMFAKMKNGLYITDISGLNSGINGQTLDFSLPCSGYVIKDGKIDKSFSMSVVAGNLMEVFNSVLALSDDVDLYHGKSTPKMLIKSLSVSGN